jgi:hypothetical protein
LLAAREHNHVAKILATNTTLDTEVGIGLGSAGDASALEELFVLRVEGPLEEVGLGSAVALEELFVLRVEGSLEEVGLGSAAALEGLFVGLV